MALARGKWHREKPIRRFSRSGFPIPHLAMGKVVDHVWQIDQSRMPVTEHRPAERFFGSNFWQTVASLAFGYRGSGLVRNRSYWRRIVGSSGMKFTARPDHSSAFWRFPRANSISARVSR